MTALLEWFRNLFQFLGYWFEESWKQAVKIFTSGWGLVLIVSTLLYTLATYIVPILALMLDTINGLITGNWDFTPPAIISTVLAIANTFAPMDELMSYATAYGVLKASLALYRFIKGLIPTEAGT